MKYVISTLTDDTRYTNWRHTSGINMPVGDVLVRGGAGRALVDGSRTVTPKGVQTEVSDEDAAFLADHPHFLEHKKRGFVEIHDRSQVPDRAAKEMATDEGSRPRTQADVKADSDKNTPPDGTPALQAVAAKTAPPK